MRKRKIDRQIKLLSRQAASLELLALDTAEALAAIRKFNDALIDANVDYQKVPIHQ